MSNVVPFPMEKRVAFIARHTTNAANMSPAAAERYIESTVANQRQALKRNGVLDTAAEREVAHLRAAIRAGLWRHVVTPERA